MTDPWLILDGYHFDGVYQQAIRDASCRVLVIDDYAHQTEYHADLILNQNINGSQMRYSADPDTEFLVGPDYALLRSQFLSFGNRDRQIAVHAHRILVTMGGADPDKVLNDVTNMPDLMAWADLAIAGGGTTWSELAFMGLPSLLLVLADNQMEVANGMTNAGASINLGATVNASAHQITKSVESVSADSNLRLSMSENARRLVDGIGVERVIKALGSQRQAV
jgi:spore coat polysaccharide biosynthesis predicted glycosyltransferase SpsG